MLYFTKHPKEVCMTYLEHLKFSISLGNIFFISFLKAYVHAFFPEIYKTSSSDTIVEVNKKILNSGCNKNK